MILSWMIIHIRIRTVVSHDNNMKIRVTHIDLVCVAFYDVSIRIVDAFVDACLNFVLKEY
jgi:hypothetical protein